MTDSPLLWYVARASGLVGWALMSASVLWGLALSTRALGARPRPAWLLDLHRFLGGLGVIFTGVHVLAILSDTYIHFGLVDVLVPFATGWHPLGVAAGIVATYLVVAIELTSLARRRLSKRAWRAVHFSSFPLFALATGHLLLVGTDGGSSVLQWVVIGVVAAVGGLTAARIMESTRGVRHPSPLDTAAAGRAERVRVPVSG